MSVCSEMRWCGGSAQVGKVVKLLVKREGWSQLPLYALGVSSGGAMALLLASHMPLQVGQALAAIVHWSIKQNG